MVAEPYSVTAATSAAGLSLNLANNLGLGGHDRMVMGGSPTHSRSPARMIAPPETLGDHALGNGTLSLRLRRLTGVDHRSRSRYFMSVGEGDRRLSSGLMDDISDAEGAGSVWSPRLRIQDIAPKGSLRVMVELVSANTLSEAIIPFSPANLSQQQSTGGGPLAVGTCYDRDKQAWSFEADTHAENGNFFCLVHQLAVHSFPNRPALWFRNPKSPSHLPGRPERSTESHQVMKRTQRA